MTVAATTDTMRVFLWVMGCSAMAMTARGSDEGSEVSPGDHVNPHAKREKRQNLQQKDYGHQCTYVQCNGYKWEEAEGR